MMPWELLFAAVEDNINANARANECDVIDNNGETETLTDEWTVPITRRARNGSVHVDGG